MSEDDARTTLQQAGFEVSSTSAPSDSTPEGIVSDQSPDGGTQASKGSTVTITISSGPSTTTVPDEVGQDKQVAIDDLKANGFKVDVQNVACGDPNQDNIVQDQDPAGGSDAPPAARSTSPFVSSEPMARVRVAVIMGGRSSEHDISVASARSVVDALDPERYDVRAIEIGQDGRWHLEPVAEQGRIGEGRRGAARPRGQLFVAVRGVDVVFPVLHGPFGEDGTVQGFLELADVAYVGAGVTASALCMDKDLFKAGDARQGVPS
jgi:hypothetical protein